MKIVLALVFTLLFIFPAFSQEKFKAKVVGVVDGDTITVMDSTGRQATIRLAGIDAPELAQEFGQAAREFLIKLLSEKKVTIDGSKRDKYGRLVAKVLVNSTDISLEMVKAGFAWHFKKYEKEQSEADRKLYADAEILARTIKKGLWTQNNPVDPSAYRAAKRAKESEQQASAESNSQPTLQDRVIFPVDSDTGSAASGSPASTNSSGNGTVHVKGYTRSDGTVVQPHTRSAPKKKN